MLSNYTNGFDNGLVVRDRKYETMFGKVFWVGNNASLEVGEKGESDGNKGTYLQPFATIDYAISQAKAGRNDVIYVRPGYTQTMTATDITVDVAGVHIIGLGSGSSMPTISHNHANAEVSIAADNVTWQGFRHRADVTGVLVGIEIEDGVDYANVSYNKFDVVTTATDEFLVTIRTNDASNFATIVGNEIDMGLGGAVAAISFTEDTDGTVVRGNRVRGDYSTACIQGITTLSTKLEITDNILINGETGALNTEPAIQLLTGSTGVIANNICICNVATPGDAIVADTAILSGNKYSETVAANALDIPFVATNNIQVAIKNQALDDADDLFDVNTGSVIVWALYATCEVDGTGSPVVSLSLDADDTVDEVLATGINIAAVNTDDTITITSGAVAINDAGSATAVMSPRVVRAGVIESVLDSGCSGNGVLKWHCVWSPLDVGATVTEAA